MQIEIAPKKVAGPVLLLLGWVLLIVAVAAISATAGRWVLVIIGLLMELAGLYFFGQGRRSTAHSPAHGQGEPS